MRFRLILLQARRKPPEKVDLMSRFIANLIETKNLQPQSGFGDKNFPFFALFLAITMDKKNSRRRQDQISLTAKESR